MSTINRQTIEAITGKLSYRCTKLHNGNVVSDADGWKPSVEGMKMKAMTKSGKWIEVDERCGIYAATHNPRRRGWIRSGDRIVLESSEHGGYGPRPRRIVDRCVVSGYERFIGREVTDELLAEVQGE